MPIRLLLLVLLLVPDMAAAQLRWVQGQHYNVLPAATPARTVPGKIEVAEVFSYACVHCYHAAQSMAALKNSLPADAYMTYLHAAFQPQQSWPLFQRAWITADTLGVGEAMHEALFRAIWETGEIPLLDSQKGGIRNPPPTIEDIARFYARHSSVKEADFLKTAASPQVAAQMRHSDAMIQAWRIAGTPTIVVNGHYIIDNSALSGWSDLEQLVGYLVSLERQRSK
jgi:thiol:disulfide interchange protein DsbA